MIINGIEVTVTGNISTEELTIYLNQQQAKSKHKIIRATVAVDDDYVDIKVIYAPIPFERLRRITGYLTGSTSGWCDSKRAELKDRTKHN